jgi:23S rRNA (uracil1939-C5)-methyltransferase
VSGDPWAYRCRIELHGGPAGNRAGLGYFARQSHDLVEPEACPIATAAVSGAIPILRDALGGLRPRGPVTLEPVAGEDGRVVVVARGDLGDPERAAKALAEAPGVGGCLASSRGHGVVRWASAGATRVPLPTDDGAGGRTTLTLDPRGFTQANLALNPVLAATVRDLAGIGPGTRVLELFAGAGNLTVPLALAGARVTAVELNREALDRAGEELRARGLEARLRAARVEDVVADPDLVTPSPEVVVADPPRTGMGPGAARALAGLPVERVVLCACDPATLARDLGPFLASGFRLDRVVLVDMFPQTFHIETVARLVRA